MLGCIALHSPKLKAGEPKAPTAALDNDFHRLLATTGIEPQHVASASWSGRSEASESAGKDVGARHPSLKLIVLVGLEMCIWPRT
jgi:hypothetical protein